MYRWFLALRYLLTRPINLLGIIGVMLGVWALIVVVSIFSGFLDVISAHVRSASADISVIGIPETAQWPLLDRVLRADPQVLGAAPRLVHTGLLHRPGERPGPPPLPGRGALQGGDGPYVSMLGVDPAQERGVTGFDEWVRDPIVPAAMRVADLLRPLQPQGALPSILLSVERMQKMGLAKGDHLLFTSGRLQRDHAGEPGALLEIHGEFVVAGAFHTRHAAFDGNIVFVHLDALRQLLRPDQPDAVLEAAVSTQPGADLEATAARLMRSLRQALDIRRQGGGPLVYSWRDREALVLGSVEHQRGLMKVVLIVIMAIAGFLMFATLLMMVGEKSGDIGILCAMGGTPGGVTQLFLCCGLVITGSGILLGIVTGCLSAIYLDAFHRFLLANFGIDLFPTKVYNLDSVPYSLDPWWIAEVSGLALLFGALVSVVPAWLAGRQNPLQSLRGL